MENLSKRFVPMAEYQRITGLSYATVNHLCESGQLRLTTESGLKRIDTQDDGSADATTIIKRLEEAERLLKALCGHLGVK